MGVTDENDRDDTRLGRRSRRFFLPNVTWSQLDGWGWFMLSVVLVLSAMIVILPIIVIQLSFREASPIEAVSGYSLIHYIGVFGDPFTYKVLWNTLGFSVITLIVSLVFGVPAAWLAERTDLPAKPVLYTMMTIGLLMPGFATAMGWLFLFHPRIGLVNAFLRNVFSLTQSPFDIASLFGMGWVQGLTLAPIAFIMTAAVLKAIDPSLEESAQMSGVGFKNIMRKVTLPLALPGILAAAIYIFTIGFAAFDVPAIIGWSNRIFTFSTYIVSQLQPDNNLPQYGRAAALSTVIVAFAGILSIWYGRLQNRAHRYQVVTGKGYRPRLVSLGKYRPLAWLFLGLYFIASGLLPLCVLIWASVIPFFQLPSAQAFATISLRNFYAIPWDLMLEGMSNTFVLMALTPTLTLACSIAFSWIVLRSKIPGRMAFDFIAFLPHAVPNIVFGVAILLFTIFVVKNSIELFGTIWILLFVFIIGRLSYGTRMINATLIQIHKDLEEAATVSGASTGTIIVRVIIPLLAPTLIYAWIWIALITFRELTLAVILTTRDNLTLPVVVWSIWESGSFGQAAAVTLLLMGLMVPFIMLYWWATRKTGLREA